MDEIASTPWRFTRLASSRPGSISSRPCRAFPDSKEDEEDDDDDDDDEDDDDDNDDGDNGDFDDGGEDEVVGEAPKV